MNAIFCRRSIRKYTAEEISEHEIEMLLRAAMQAPSAGNEQPWHFVVIRSKETLAQIEAIHTHGKMLSSANAAILVCGDTKALLYEREYWIMDCSAAMQNILLQATGMGLGSVWLGVYPLADRMEHVSQILHLPSHVLPLGIAALGYPMNPKSSIDAFHPERIHREQW